MARLDAYGWDGEWAARRGFDSLVQMSCGIAYLDGHAAPSPLPVQALDHATGYLLAGAVCRALSTLIRTGVPGDIRTSLVATATRLVWLTESRSGSGSSQAGAGSAGAGSAGAGSDWAGSDWPDEVFGTADTAWGRARRVRVPGTIEGIEPSWGIDAGPLGRHEAAFD